ncbi:Uncharacterised protein [Klebsiella quasivariicola]|nr:Uncharacterised protein [Klebsiella quasivariicola]
MGHIYYVLLARVIVCFYLVFFLVVHHSIKFNLRWGDPSREDQNFMHMI